MIPDLWNFSFYFELLLRKLENVIMNNSQNLLTTKSKSKSRKSELMNGKLLKFDVAAPKQLFQGSNMSLNNKYVR